MSAAIEVQGLVKRFGSKLAVNGVSFQVEVGQCYGLIGPNGAGKTTTFSVMAGYLGADGGQVRLLGADPARPGALKGKVGVLPQDALLPPTWAVGALLTYWGRLGGVPQPVQAARAALERVGLLDSWPTRAGALSHGMAKRVAMAQALLGDPPVLLLDEPTAGLDPKVAAALRQLLKELKGRHTIVVSSHNLQELEELCDASALLDRGTLVTAASMAELTSQTSEFRVQIARGDVPLPTLRELPGVASVALDPSGALTVHYRGKEVAPEEVITQTLQRLLAAGVLVSGVTRGRRLEDRVLQLT